MHALVHIAPHITSVSAPIAAEAGSVSSQAKAIERTTATALGRITAVEAL